jgi:hypothetical protein
VNPLPSKNEREEFDKAFSARLTGEPEKKSGELRLADRQQPPFFNIAGQFGAKLVHSAKPGVSKKVLAVMVMIRIRPWRWPISARFWWPDKIA